MSLSTNQIKLQVSTQYNVPEWVVIIGANTGGPQALAKLLPQFPATFPGSIIVVQQMRPGFTRVLAEHLNHICSLPVSEPEDGQAVQTSSILIAPSGYKLKLVNNDEKTLWPCRVILEEYSRQPGSRINRIDYAMESASAVFGHRTIGVLLTGLGADGCSGMRSILDFGGFTIAQDATTSIIHNLPSSAINEGTVQEVLPLWSIADRITDITGALKNATVA